MAALLARDGSLSAMHLPPALVHAQLLESPDSGTASLTAEAVSTPGCSVPSFCMGHSLEFLPSAGLMVASLGAMDGSRASWLLSGHPVCDGTFLCDVSLAQQPAEQVRRVPAQIACKILNRSRQMSMSHTQL